MQKAFTLAEVLITLGIIGVVAALTLPTIISNYEKKVVATKLQKVFSILNQVTQQANNDQGEISDQEAMDMGADLYFEKYWKPYMDIDIICSNTACGYSSSAPFKFMNGVGNLDSYAKSNSDRTAFITRDGIFYSIQISISGYPRNWLLVDINGPKKPNTMGKDVFFFIARIPGGKVLPYGYQAATNTNVDNGCNKNTYGYSCAEKIRRAGWLIDDTYDW